MRTLGITVACLTVVLVGAPSSAGAQADPANPAALTEAFLARANEYVTLQKRIESTMPPVKETSDVAKLAAHQIALAESIRMTRGLVPEGSIFADDIKPYFVRIIRNDWMKRTPRDRQGVLQEVPKGLQVKVNMSYPTAFPLATFPPALLAQLPDVPRELEYRFFGRHLILRDVKANLVVDILRDVIPQERGE